MAQEVREHLSAKQERAIAALMTSKTIEAAAAVAGVSPRSIYRWMEDPLFEAEWRAARRQAMDSAIGFLQAGACEAVEALRNALGDRSVHVKVRAAAILLEHVMTANMQFNLDERLRALEEQAEEHAAW